MKTVVIFDMDGVILDTERLVQICWKIISEETGYPDLCDMIKQGMGADRPSRIRLLKERYGDDFPAEELLNESSRIFHEKFDGSIPAKDGARELLEYLSAGGYRLSLASSTRKQIVEKELADVDLLKYFEEVICGDMVTHSKPDPEIFLLAARKLGADPTDCYVVEDSYNGIRAAYAADMHPIMVPDQLQPDEEMKALAEFIVPSLADVQKLAAAGSLK